mmetsp:Transcript_46620/g.99550  ORF Transcript_46620/g.99550 Transcript_46620/m.99550 type:complete len:214 (-) Transcript_46620:476-1117(-)
MRSGSALERSWYPQTPCPASATPIPRLAQRCSRLSSTRPALTPAKTASSVSTALCPPSGNSSTTSLGANGWGKSMPRRGTTTTTPLRRAPTPPPPWKHRRCFQIRRWWHPCPHIPSAAQRRPGRGEGRSCCTSGRGRSRSSYRMVHLVATPCASTIAARKPGRRYPQGARHYRHPRTSRASFLRRAWAWWCAPTSVTRPVWSSMAAHTRLWIL